MDRNDPRDPRTNPNINNDDIPTRMTENPGARPYGEETGQYPILEERGFSAYDAHNDPYPYTDSTDFQSQPPRTPTGGWANQDVVDNQYDEPASETEDPEMDGYAPEKDKGEKGNTGLIIAVSVAGTALALLIAFMVLGNNGGGSDPADTPVLPPSTSEEAPPPPPVAPEAITTTLTETPAPRDDAPAPPPQIIVIPDRGGADQAPPPPAPPAAPPTQDTPIEQPSTSTSAPEETHDLR